MQFCEMVKHGPRTIGYDEISWRSRFFCEFSIIIQDNLGLLLGNSNFIKSSYSPGSSTVLGGCQRCVIASWLSWLMPCCSQCNIGYRPLHAIQLCPVLPPPSSSSCTWNKLSTQSFSRSLFRCSFCSACLAMLPSFLLCLCPSRFHFYARQLYRQVLLSAY